MKEKMAKLLTVKSIVTLVATFVFAYLAVIDSLNEQFMLVYTAIISFYFGTQHERRNTEAGGGNV